MKAYLYVLHFDTKLHHAQHYIGATTMPLSRLITHAHGRGAAIVKAQMRAGATWRLGGLFGCRGDMYSAEKKMKATKNGRLHCSLCEQADRGHAKPPEGCWTIDLSLFEWPQDSTTLRGMIDPETSPQLRLATVREQPWVFQALREMMQVNRYALGWIPCGGDGGLIEYAQIGNLLLAQRREQFIGSYDLWGYTAIATKEAEWVKVQQCVIADGARFRGMGRAMIEKVRTMHPKRPVVARVKQELDANDFWRQIGFELRGSETHITSGQPANFWWREPLCS